MEKKNEFFDIDIHRLDDEWVKQPENYYRHATILADARKEYEEAKVDLELVEANLDLTIRSSPSEFGLEKVTESVVKSAIIIDKTYQGKNKEVLIAKHRVNVAQVAVDTLDHKKKALENAVQLHLANYFSTPKIKGENGETMKKVERDKAFSKKGR